MASYLLININDLGAMAISSVVVVDQFTPGYQFKPTLNFLEDV